VSFLNWAEKDGTIVIHAPGYRKIAVLSLYGKPWERADGAG
jgi:hypothetical protein